MKILALIPARYASTRFPGKPLAMLAGKCIIEHVYERVSRVYDDVYVATDDERIAAKVKEFGGQYVMTATTHKSGTDRCCEALDKIEQGLSEDERFDVVVNIQGDEPFIAIEQLESINTCFEEEQTDIATLVMPFGHDVEMEVIENPNSPKVVVDAHGYALYFSRSVIPFVRDAERKDWTRFAYLKHIGLYAYRAAVLRKVTKMPQSALELAESLEQLRWLEAGLKIKTKVTNIATIGIDTPRDLELAEKEINNRK